MTFIRSIGCSINVSPRRTVNILYGFGFILWVLAFIVATVPSAGRWAFAWYIRISDELRNFVTRNLFSDDELQSR